MRKAEFDAKLKGISDRVTKNKTKHLLVENELKKFFIIFGVRTILKAMTEHKIRWFFKSNKNILKMSMVVKALVLEHGNQRVYLTNH